MPILFTWLRLEVERVCPPNLLRERHVKVEVHLRRLILCVTVWADAKLARPVHAHARKALKDDTLTADGGVQTRREHLDDKPLVQRCELRPFVRVGEWREQCRLLASRAFASAVRVVRFMQAM